MGTAADGSLTSHPVRRQLGIALLIAAALTAVRVLGGRATPSSIVVGFLLAAVWFASALHRLTYPESVRSLDLRRRGAATRAVRSGELPQDASLESATLALAEAWAVDSPLMRSATWILIGCGGVSIVFCALAASQEEWLSAAVNAGFAGFCFFIALTFARTRSLATVYIESRRSS